MTNQELNVATPVAKERSLAADFGLLTLSLLIGPPGGFFFTLVLICRARFS